MKIDTEGHELNVVKSGLKTLKKTSYLLIEFRQNDLYLNYSSKALHKLVLKNNFKLVKNLNFLCLVWKIGYIKIAQYHENLYSYWI